MGGIPRRLVDDVLRAGLVERLEDELLQRGIERLPGRLLDDGAEQVGVRVGVDLLGARCELGGLAQHESVEVREGEDALRILGERVDEVLVGVVGVAAGHAGELAQGDPVAVGDTLDVLVDRVVERDHPLIDELQDERHGVGLGDAAQWPLHRGIDRYALLEVGTTGHRGPRALAGDPDADGSAGHPVLGHRLFDGLLEVGPQSLR